MRAFTRSVLAVSAFIVGFGLSPAQNPTTAEAATVRAVVDISSQRMQVFVNGKQKYRWPVSTGTKAYPTPLGTFTPFGRKRKSYSKTWNMNLTYLVEFDIVPVNIKNKGKRDFIAAVHGTSATGKLGRRASHGCVRLSHRNAAIFYNLVNKHGLWNSQIVVRR